MEKEEYFKEEKRPTQTDSDKDKEEGSQKIKKDMVKMKM